MPRGQGIGKGGTRQGDFGASGCVCPNCGYTQSHARGRPCQMYKCPHCNSRLVGA